MLEISITPDTLAEVLLEIYKQRIDKVLCCEIRERNEYLKTSRRTIWTTNAWTSKQQYIV